MEIRREEKRERWGDEGRHLRSGGGNYGEEGDIA